MQARSNGGTSNKRKSQNVLTDTVRMKGRYPYIPDTVIPKFREKNFIATRRKKQFKKKRQIKDRSGIVFAIDTNVFLSKPSALFSLEEHDVYVPDTVLSELDKFKRGNSKDGEDERKRSANARITGNLLVEHAERVPMEALKDGIPILLPDNLSSNGKPLGKLYLGTCTETSSEKLEVKYPAFLDPSINDHKILMECLDWMAQEKVQGGKRSLVLLSKDKLMRLNALRAGIPAEDYVNDAIDEENVRSTGVHYMPESFWDMQDDLECFVKQGEEQGRTYYTLKGKELETMEVNEFIVLKTPQEDVHLQITKKLSRQKARTRIVLDYMNRYSVFGIQARNIGQNFAVNVLMDPEIFFVVIEGPAGSGKNMVAVAAGAEQIKMKRFSRIVATRDALPVGRETGFKPGDEEQKMTPWMGGVLDNLDELISLNKSKNFSVKERKKRQKEDKKNGIEAENSTESPQGTLDGPLPEDSFLEAFKNKYLFLKEISSLRGRSLINTFLIFDENQNSTREQQRMLLTRAGTNSKVVCLGNFRQVDRYFSERTSGLARVIDITRGWHRAARITLQDVERSEIAAFFEANL